MTKGCFYTSGGGSGGLQIPISSVYENLGYGYATNLIEETGTQVDKTSDLGVATYQKYKLNNGKLASFNASTTPIVTMTSASTPAGYSVTQSNQSSGHEAWKLFDNNDSTTWAYSLSGFSQWDTLTIPSAQIIFGLTIVGYSDGTSMPYSGAIQGYDTDYFNLAAWNEYNWSNYETKSFTPIVLTPTTKIRYMHYASKTNAAAVYSLKIFGADLAASVIKCTAHGKTTGTAVIVAPDVNSGTLPTGLVEETTYYLREGADANKFTLYDTQAHAVAGGSTGLITITDAGTGEFYMDDAGKVTMPNTPNSFITYGGATISDPKIAIPSGIVYTNNAFDLATDKFTQDGSQVTKSSPLGTAAYNSYGLLYGKYCSFNASTTPIVTMTSASTPAGYSVTQSNQATGYEAWKLFDNNDGTRWTYSTNGFSQWDTLTIPSAQIIFGLTIAGYDDAAYMPYSGAIQGYDTDYFNLAAWYEYNWSNLEIKSFTPLVLTPTTKIRYMQYASKTNAVAVYSLKIFGADLSASVIKCTAHGKTTGTAVHFAAKAGGTLPTGISALTTYYLREGADANKFTLYDTQAHAVAGGSTGLITITNAGTGEFYMDDADKVTLGGTGILTY